MKKKFVMSALLCVLGIVVTAMNWSTKTKVTTISDTTEVGLAEIPENGWQYACFAPAHHHLDRTEFDFGPSACWNGKGVPERWTYLTFYSKDGSCERYRIQADFLIRHGADFRCFPIDEGEDIQISISDGVLRLR